MAEMAGVDLSGGVLSHFREQSRAQIARAARENPPTPAPATDPPRLAEEVRSLARNARVPIDLRI